MQCLCDLIGFLSKLNRMIMRHYKRLNCFRSWAWPRSYTITSMWKDHRMHKSMQHKMVNNIFLPKHVKYIVHSFLNSTCWLLTRAGPWNGHSCFNVECETWVLNQAAIDCKCCNSWVEADKIVLPDTYMTVLSAYIWKSAPRHNSGKSFIYKPKRSEPKTEACGLLFYSLRKMISRC